MFVLTDPNDKHFKKIEKIARTKECIVCNNKLKDTGIYFSDDQYSRKIHYGQNPHKYNIYYSIGCRCCKAIYTSKFELVSMDYTRTAFFA